MTYNLTQIREDTIHEWDGPDFYILRYWPRNRGLSNDTSDFILDFKKKRSQAIQLAVKIAIQAVRENEEILHTRYKCRYVLTIPPSKAFEPNWPGEQVCQQLAAEFEWLKHLHYRLARVETVQKSAWAKPGERPDYDIHIRTIKPIFESADIVDMKDCAILMFDDIITRKETSQACRDILVKATGCKRVIGLYLGRTQ